MRLSLRKSEPNGHLEESQRLKSEVKSEDEKNDTDTSKLTFILKEDMEFCRKSLR